jgi:hypothetical protein
LNTRLKPLRISFNLDAATVEEAIADLESRYVQPTKSGGRLARKPTDYPIAALCKALIDDWRSQAVTYRKGNLTLSFSGGKVRHEADLVIYKPEEGDRFLYARPPDPAAPRQLGLDGLEADSPGDESYNTLLNATVDALSEFAANQRAIERRIEQLLSENAALKSTLKAQSEEFSHRLKAALDAQASAYAKLLSSQITSTALHFNTRLDKFQAQLDALNRRSPDATYTSTDEVAEDDAVPSSDEAWRQRIKDTWGTVGDYEQYADTYREDNAEKPLCQTPDWVMLCEVEWARKLSPTLAALYELIHDRDGIGYDGANILHQFGRHIDPDTGDRYYIYHRAGFNAYEALWQTIRNPQHSWLREVQQIAACLKKGHRDIFQLFGWEEDAIASLASVIERVYQERQSAYNARSQYNQPPPKKPGNSLSDQLAMLNLGPFTPITPEAIKRAYRQAMKAAHPDTGGSKEQAQKVNEAYEAVLRHYFPEAKAKL